MQDQAEEVNQQALMRMDHDKCRKADLELRPRPLSYSSALRKTLQVFLTMRVSNTSNVAPSFILVPPWYVTPAIDQFLKQSRNVFFSLQAFSYLEIRNDIGAPLDIISGCQMPKSEILIFLGSKMLLQALSQACLSWSQCQT